MRNRLLFVLGLVVVLSASGCARSPSTDGVSRTQSPTLSEPIGNSGLPKESKSYQRFDP